MPIHVKRSSGAALALVLAACSVQPADNAAEAVNAMEVTEAENGAISSPAPPLAEPAPAATPIAPGEPGGLENGTTPVSEARFSDTSAQGASQVVQRYYAFLEAGRYDEAFKLWEPNGVRMNRAAFAASFAKYSEYHAQIGAPGRIDAGAGQRYVTVPVQVYGRLKGKREQFNLRGDVILHRAEVDGATPEQKGWRIRSTDLKPRPGAAAPDPAPPGSEDNRSTARYRCMDGSRLVVAYDPDNRRVAVTRNGRRTVLKAERAASGIAYSDGKVRWSGKGERFTYAAAGQPPIACAMIGG